MVSTTVTNSVGFLLIITLQEFYCNAGMYIIASYAVYNSIVSVSLPSSEQESCSVDGEIRLSGGSNEFEGRVEVCIGGVLSRWCPPVRNITREASVVCRQLHNSTGEVYLCLYTATSLHVLCRCCNTEWSI